MPTKHDKNLMENSFLRSSQIFRYKGDITPLIIEIGGFKFVLNQVVIEINVPTKNQIIMENSLPIPSYTLFSVYYKESKGHNSAHN